jgi:hypothetical protein
MHLIHKTPWVCESWWVIQTLTESHFITYFMVRTPSLLFRRATYFQRSLHPTEGKTLYQFYFRVSERSCYLDTGRHLLGWTSGMVWHWKMSGCTKNKCSVKRTLRWQVTAGLMWLLQRGRRQVHLMTHLKLSPHHQPQQCTHLQHLLLHVHQSQGLGFHGHSELKMEYKAPYLGSKYCSTFPLSCNVPLVLIHECTQCYQTSSCCTVQCYIFRCFCFPTF